uniref:Peroxisomal membrane protein 4 n=1 Tax=Plectus sambesii TaxID=2011161 RepID=A0A914WG01_9BILA
MESLENLHMIVNYLISSKKYHFLLAAIKGLRNGAVYGVRIRAPHALVMVFLFGSGTVWKKLLTILKLTRTHAVNLAKFVFSYKLIHGGLGAIEGRKKEWHSFVAAFIMGYFVFGKNNGVNMQINLYLLSRIMVGLARLAVQKGVLPEPQGAVFPWFAAVVWGVVLWLFEHHQSVLQGSLQASMTYLYHDSNRWNTLRNFLWVNK